MVTRRKLPVFRLTIKEPSTEELAERLYVTYLRARGGPKMPWAEASDRVKRGWRAVAQEVMSCR